MSSSTSNYGFILPAVNSPDDEDLWGDELNTNTDNYDGLFLTAINNLTSAVTTNFSVAAPVASSSNTGDNNKVFLCDATSAGITALLPASALAGNGFTVGFKKTDSSVNTITIQANGAEKIDGSSTLVLLTRYSSVYIVSDGVSSWNIQATSPDLSGYAPLNSPAFTGNPTAPTASFNTRTTQLATTAFANPAALLGASGYIELPSGIIVQWDSATLSDNGSTTKSLPIAFPNHFYRIITGVESNFNPSGSDKSPTCWGYQSSLSQVYLAYNDATGSPLSPVVVSYLAIGD